MHDWRHIVTGIILSCLTLKLASADPGRPHIVVIMADDLGYHDVGFNGSLDARTQRLDQLANEAAVLRSMYVQPVCSPTRAAFMTGRYPIRYGLQVGIISPQDEFGLDISERTVAQALQCAGYKTAICGKWHLGWSKPEFMPLARGFITQYGMIAAGYIDYFRHTRPGIGRDWYRQQEPLVEEGYATDLIAAEAAGTIAGHDPTVPLFLFVAFNAPHSPFQPPNAPPKFAGVSEKRRDFLQMIESLDAGVGRIADALSQRGMLQDTLLVFTSDNGGVAPGVRADNSPLRAGKGTLYEGGVRACCFARWPGRIAPGPIDEPVHVVDWLPTFVSLAGGQTDDLADLDGLDITSVLVERLASPHSDILMNASPKSAALRKDNWKLVVHKRGGRSRAELYDLASDISETKNVADDHPEIVEALRARLQEYEDAAVEPLKKP